MGKTYTCYHPGCRQPPMREMVINPRLSVGYCEHHYQAALKRKREIQAVSRIMRGEKT